MSIFYNSIGQEVQLSKKIGTGGEGTVYRVTSHKDVVAKKYHKPIDGEKQGKIIAMIKCADDALRKVTAWPLDTLHETKNGNICGFIMPDITGCEPLHHLYSPSHRKQQFPNMDWVFLLNVCRNIAAAFGAIHARKHVIGDVNPNLVVVSENTIARFIDCDSFQISYAGNVYSCEVGVPHFTPQELQGRSSFKGIKRTENHDNFGLALLIFHILLMGRHPFSGVYTGSSDMPLEEAIKKFLYAFSDNPLKTRKIAPPPNSMTPSILPDDIKMLFEKAFTELGSTFSRPTARKWVIALDSFRQKLRSCGREPIHKYYNRLSQCPWCRTERIGIFYFFSTSDKTFNNINTFNIDSIWKKILSILPPKTRSSDPTTQLNYLSSQVKARPLPQELLDAKSSVIFKKISAVIIVIASYAIWPEAFLLSLLPAAYLFFSEVDYSLERNKRNNAFSQANWQLNAIIERWDKEAGTSSFHKKLNELKKYHDNYKNLNNYYSAELKKLEQNKRQKQLNAYLARFYISNAKITGIGPARKSALASFGIETAAEVQWNDVIRVSGFGQKLTREIVDWKKGIERRFTFDSSKAVDPTEVAKLKKRFANKKRDLEGKLLSGPEQLIQIRNHILQQRKILSPQVTTALKNVAQAQADLQVITNMS